MDPGQIYGDLREADLTRKIAPKVIPYIEKAKIEVKGVPLDLPLLQRVEWINNTGYTDTAGDVCVEIHVNDGNKRGIEAWFRGEGGNNSQKLAKVLVDTICAETGYQSQGIKAEHQHELRSLIFLNRTNPATVLLETLYIDNPEDIAILKDDAKLEELAKSIAKGILKYLGKDMEGNDLPEDQKPKYDDLKPVPAPPAPNPADMFGGLGLDDDDMFGGLGGSGMPKFTPPAPVAPPTTPTVPSPIGNLPSFTTPRPGIGGMGSGGMMDREQRREMIKKNYVKFLGREPSPSDMNYFLSNGINEQDLIQKMVDSQEHQDLVKSKQELADAKQKITDLESENAKLKSSQKDQAELMKNLQTLLEHKNKSIFDLEQAVFSKHGVPSSVVTQRASSPEETIGGNAGRPEMKRSITERFFEWLSKALAK